MTPTLGTREDEAERRSVARPCPVCRQPVAARVCDPCGVDVDTGDLVAAPMAARIAPGAPKLGASTAPRERPAAPPWGALDVLRGLVDLRALLPELIPVAALLAPLLLCAAASERPWADLSPTSLLEVVRRAPGSFARATLWSLVALGPGLVAARWASPLAVWRPVALVVAFTCAGLAAGYLRREAETSR